MDNLTPINFIPGQAYKRRDLHDRFSGQEQGGICTPTKFPIIILFTGDTGSSFGYYDAWDEGIFKYTGEGQFGDMKFVRGNRAVRDHIKEGKDLHLFRYIRSGIVVYVGQMVCVETSWSRTIDFNRVERQAIVFHLQPIEAFANIKPENDLLQTSLVGLRQLAVDASSNDKKPQSSTASVTQISIRAEAVRLYAFKRASGHCESCNIIAPFKTLRGDPFLECHHLMRLSDGGPDHPVWVAGICPNCHRHIHYGSDGCEINNRLISTIRSKEAKFAEFN